jgi:hypothetical protein
MQTATTVSPAARWTGFGLGGLVTLFLLADGLMKLVPLPQVTETMGQLGYADSVGLARTLGVVTLVSTILYAIPRTSMLGAILLTAYLGGAVATHVRVGSPLFTHTLFGVYLALLAWGGLWLRNDRVRRMLPLLR